MINPPIPYFATAFIIPQFMTKCDINLQKRGNIFQDKLKK
jgi:hypothetical protein